METSEDNFGLIIFKQKKYYGKKWIKTQLNSFLYRSDNISLYKTMEEDQKKNITTLYLIKLL